MYSTSRRPSCGHDPPTSATESPSSENGRSFTINSSIVVFCCTEKCYGKKNVFILFYKIANHITLRYMHIVMNIIVKSRNCYISDNVQHEEQATRLSRGKHESVQSDSIGNFRSRPVMLMFCQRSFMLPHSLAVRQSERALIGGRGNLAPKAWLIF